MNQKTQMRLKSISRGGLRFGITSCANSPRAILQCLALGLQWGSVMPGGGEFPQGPISPISVSQGTTEGGKA